MNGRTYVHDDGGRSKYFKGSCGDCVVRAIAICLQRDYKEIYDFVFKTCERSPRNGLTKSDTRKVMKKLGFSWFPTMGVGTGCKVHFTPNELPEGRIILQLAGHVACSVNGVPHDTFDSSRCGKACVYGYWKT